MPPLSARFGSAFTVSTAAVRGLGLGLGLGLCGAAQAAPSFDCAKAESTVAELICTDDALAVLDVRLAARFAEAIGAVQGLDTGAAAAEDRLRATQRGWISGRDECWKDADLRACVETSYLTREGQLVARWMLEEPVGIDFWACAGNPANEVVTMYFDTPLPSVRIERGDTVDVGTAVRSASGTKYAASFGRSIWIKGAEATYREADPDGTSLTCTRGAAR